MYVLLRPSAVYLRFDDSPAELDRYNRATVRLGGFWRAPGLPLMVSLQLFCLAGVDK